MTNINILTKKEEKNFNKLPNFDFKQQNHYFDIPEKLVNGLPLHKGTKCDTVLNNYLNIK